MPSKKPMKAPFVVTISVAAAATFAVACGGKAFDTGDGGPDPVGPGTGYCDPARTKLGDPCSASQTSCTVSVPYGGGTAVLQCIDGQWSGSDIVNPPSPPSPPPPVQRCPPTEPRGADYCYAWGTQCTYLDLCAERPDGYPTNRVYECTNGSWKRQLPYVATCPQPMPKNGDSCATCSDDYPVECKYPQGTGGTSCPPVVATCNQKTRTWQVSISSCNPPPPDAGP